MLYQSICKAVIQDYVGSSSGQISQFHLLHLSFRRFCVLDVGGGIYVLIFLKVVLPVDPHPVKQVAPPEDGEGEKDNNKCDDGSEHVLPVVDDGIHNSLGVVDKSDTVLWKRIGYRIQ